MRLSVREDTLLITFSIKLSLFKISFHFLVTPIKFTIYTKCTIIESESFKINKERMKLSKCCATWIKMLSIISNFNKLMLSLINKVFDSSVMSFLSMFVFRYKYKHFGDLTYTLKSNFKNLILHLFLPKSWSVYLSTNVAIRLLWQPKVFGIFLK